MKYTYLGNQPVELVGFGIVYPKDVIETSMEIRHPNFKLEVRTEANEVISQPKNKKTKK